MTVIVMPMLPLRYMVLTRLLTTIRGLYFCGVLGGVFLRMDTKRHLFKQDITMCSNFLTFMGSIINCNWGYLYDI